MQSLLTEERTSKLKELFSSTPEELINNPIQDTGLTRLILIVISGLIDAIEKQPGFMRIILAIATL